MAHQWYWSFDYTDLFPYWFNLETNSVDIDDFVIDLILKQKNI